MSSEPARITAKASPLPMQLAALACLVGIGVSFACSGIYFLPPADKVALWGFLGMPFFGALLLLAMAKLGERDVVLRVRRDGFFYSRYSDDLIPWEAIEAVKDCGMGSHRVICIDLVEPRDHRPGLRAERSVEGARLYNFGQFAISMRGLAGRHDKVADAIEAHLQRRKRATKFVAKPVEPAPVAHVPAGFGQRKRLRGLAAAV